jgi:hypothetical protein
MSNAVAADYRRRSARRLIFVADLVLLLFPPIYWLFSSGPGSLWYFLTANLLVALSLFGLWALNDRDEEVGR